MNDMTSTVFVPFPKMARLSREIIITEKIDGSNASIFITAGSQYSDDPYAIASKSMAPYAPDLYMYVGSRTRWITPSADNFGFAAWCLENSEALFDLGEGHHFGEWWGRGIQRNYSLTERRFSLFNTKRWGVDRPSCCDVVPELWRGEFNQSAIHKALSNLKSQGSVASPGFMNPEGIVIYHTAAGVGFKKTIEDDEIPKSFRNAA